jgi:hypothetical protein
MIRNDKNEFERALERASVMTGVWSFKDLLPGWMLPQSDSEQEVNKCVANLARYLGIEQHLLEDHSEPSLRPLATVKFKGAEQDAVHKHTEAAYLASILARNLVFQVEQESLERMSAFEVRKRVLEVSGIINLESIARFCWSIELPVAHIPKLTTSNPHAMAMMVDGKYAIILARNQRWFASHLFDLLHELGHIMLGHIVNNESFVDISDSLDSNEEIAANQFAVQVLTGEESIPTISHARSAVRLAEKAEVLGEKYQVDPGILVANYGRVKNCHGFAVNAQKILQGEKSHANHVIEKILQEQLTLAETSSYRLDIIRPLAIG